jgi:hypothetical protein
MNFIINSFYGEYPTISLYFLFNLLTYFVKNCIIISGYRPKIFLKEVSIMFIVISTILAFVLALTATILTFVFIVPEKKRERLNKFWKFIHDTVNFKYLIVEKILQAMYIFATAYVILQGFFMLFSFTPGYGSGIYRVDPQWQGGYGLLTMILGPIGVRLMYEFIMMLILLIKNVIQINNKIKANNDSAPKDASASPNFASFTIGANSTASTPVANPVVSPEPAPATVEEPPEVTSNAVFCTKCGAKADDGSIFCSSCGTKLN